MAYIVMAGSNETDPAVALWQFKPLAITTYTS